MLNWFRRRYVAGFLMLVMLLMVWLAAGTIVSGSTLGGGTFNPGPAVSLPPPENSRGENGNPINTGGGAPCLSTPDHKPVDCGDNDSTCSTLPADENGAPENSTPENDANSTASGAESAKPSGSAAAGGTTQSLAAASGEAGLPAAECQQDTAPASPEPAPSSENIPAEIPAREDLPPYFLGKPDCRRFGIRLRIENLGGTEAENIRLQVPVLGRLNSPYQTIKSEQFSLEPVEISGGEGNSRCAHFLIPGLPAGESISIGITYELTVYPITANYSTYTGDSSRLLETAYLQPSARIESDHPEITSRAVQITGGAGNDLEKARAIYQFVRQHMRYDSNAACRNQGALSALRQKVGVCEDYAALFVALCRAVNIPARQVNGYADPKGTGQSWNQSGSVISLKGYRHSWAEFYLEGLGWLPVDPTMNINTRDDKYFGCLPCTSHIVQNYFDQSLRIKFQGGRLEASWVEELF